MSRQRPFAYSRSRMLRHRILYPLFLLTGFVALLIGIFGDSFIWFLLAVVIGVGITAWGAFDIRQGYFVQTFFRKKHPVKGLISLTFDDGPSPYTPEILRLLKAYRYQATFFCIGKEVLAYPDVARQIVDEGHSIGNHTYMHRKSFGFQKEKEVVAELEQADLAIQQTIGKKPKLFRPPYGVTNPSIAKAVQYTKHQVIGWSNRSLDTVTLNEDKIYKRVCRKLQSGDIILFHDTSLRTVKVLEQLLPYLQKQGYMSVSVDDLLNLHAYEE